MRYHLALLVPWLLAINCDPTPPPESQLRTVTIIPYSQDEDALIGSVYISQYYPEKNYWLPKAVIQCSDEEPVHNPEEISVPSYEIDLAIGHYKITAHDLNNRCEHHQELIITSSSPTSLYVDLMPD